MNSSYSARGLLGKFVGEFCAPVVVTVTTAEVENICQKNGLLLHELLSAFGHLDSINSVIRTGSGTLPVTDAHIRFERVTELKPKTSSGLEEVRFFDTSKQFIKLILFIPTYAPKTNQLQLFSTSDHILKNMTFLDYRKILQK